LSHGHFDKLSFSYYNNSSDVLQDYGLARFVNIEQKGGGNYLKENTTWAKQTIAHNTIVQNEKSHFGADFETGNQFSSKKYLYDVSNPKVQIISATEANAYPGSKMHRTMVMLQDEGYEKPILLDVFQIDSDKTNQYDLPFYYTGQMMSSNFPYETPKTLEPLGKSFGYQHLWKEGIGKATAENMKISWLDNGVFYTLTSATQPTDELLFVRLGANDPNFNLRRDPGFIIRKKNSQKATFVNVVEAHGSYSPVTEVAVNAFSSIENLELVYEGANYVAVTIKNKNGNTILFVLATANNSVTQKHQLQIKDKTYSWVGPHYKTAIN
jgi:oligo-alginate lyase